MATATEAFERAREAIIAERGTGIHLMNRCLLCGHTTFMSTQPAKVSEVINLELSPTECSRCSVVAAQNPQIYQWIIGVYSNLRLLAERAAQDTIKSQPSR